MVLGRCKLKIDKNINQIKSEQLKDGISSEFRELSDKHQFFFQAEDGIRDRLVTGVLTCALPI